MTLRLVGHRGARGEAPENTLAGFGHLHALGLRAVEFDIQVSADDQLMVIHDPTVDRTTPGRGRVRAHPAARLQALGVPTLSSVLALLDDFDHLELEVKARETGEEAVVAEALPALWRQHALAGRARATSFNARFLERLRRQSPDIARGFLFEADFAGDPVALARTLGCTSLGPHQLRCTEALVAAAHAAGLQVSTWTVNSAERAQALAALGVDALITDFPTAARSWLPHAR